MALLPDFGIWPFRSGRRDAFSDRGSPVAAVERLNSLSRSRPLQSADKDTLVGAVLSMVPSLQLALHMLVELLPEDDSRDRLGEVLCPSLGQLQNSLKDALSSFGHVEDEQTRPFRGRSQITSRILLRPAASATPSETRSHRSRNSRAPSEPRQAEKPKLTPATQPARPRARDPVVDKTPHAQNPMSPSGYERPDPAADMALRKELQAEMRVNAAIQVAVDSLEFAEEQLRIVKDVNKLHGGGSFHQLEKNFYTGYNRLLFHALELERREFNRPSPGLAHESDPDMEPAVEPQPLGTDNTATAAAAGTDDGVVATGDEPPSPHRQPPPPQPQNSLPPLQRFVSFDNSLPFPLLSQSPTPTTSIPEAEGPRSRLTRRNTIQIIKEEKPVIERQKLKRRLSLAEELALAGEDDDTGDEWDGEGHETDSLRADADSDSVERDSESESEELNGDRDGDGDRAGDSEGVTTMSASASRHPGCQYQLSSVGSVGVSHCYVGF
ncbi:hypothetical protein B0T22DRAFT_443293 [Podospora appendiculata]|uniref:Uncharacterized protein n=1 Tax=Podospora appendiculata TaxID=314037 RepID=A0AAE1CB50_9PEZI|nr:hypothetical protein B0T22DRAFT_443293 [Podospora appendiculata]